MNQSEVKESAAQPRWVGFWSMIGQQTQNAFNDKFAQFLLIPLAGAIGYSVETLAGLLIVLPFVLFSPIAGWLSDRFSKRDVLLGSAILQVACLIWICTAIGMKNLPLALCGFFAIAAQSTFFSPAKMGICKELVGSRHLGFATAIQQMLALLGLLAGQIIAGRLFDARLAGGSNPWSAALGPLAIATVLSFPAVVMAWMIPRVPAHGTGSFSMSTAVGHFVSLKEMWRHRSIRRASFGIAFFWGFGGFFNLWSVKYANALTGGGAGFGTISSLFMLAASIGAILGFASASFLQRKHVELGWVPAAALLMAAGCGLFALLPEANAESFKAIFTMDPAAVAVALAESPAAAGFLFLMGLLAFLSALYLAPLNAWIQDAYPAEKRGEFQSAVNLQNCLAGMLALVLLELLKALGRAVGFSPTGSLIWQMLPLALACLAAAALIVRAMPAPFIRVVVVPLMRLMYGIRAVHPERVPHSGGVLLLPNHVTFIDAFLISTASPRPVRFVMDEVFARQRAIRVFTAIFETVNIRRDKPLDAIREVIRALDAGEAICLFPEGQLTRTGTLSGLQKGFELIARKTSAPLIPVWADGSWGSISSFERGRFFRKLPRKSYRGVKIAFGQPLRETEKSTAALRAALHRTSSEALAACCNSPVWKLRKPSGKNPATKFFRRCDEPERRRIWRNARQIAMVNAIPRGAAIHCLENDPVLAELPGLLAAFPSLYGGTVTLHPWFDGEHPGTWVGGDFLREAIQITQITKPVTFYDFGTDAADRPMERGDLAHLPCLAIAGKVVTMSMPHPEPSAEETSPQPGHRPHSWGRLLPGWHLVAVCTGDHETLVARGPAAAFDLPLPEGSSLDEEFLCSAQKSRSR